MGFGFVAAAAGRVVVAAACLLGTLTALADEAPRPLPVMGDVIQTQADRAWQYHRPAADEAAGEPTATRQSNGDWVIDGEAAGVANAPIAKLFPRRRAWDAATGRWVRRAGVGERAWVLADSLAPPPRR